MADDSTTQLQLLIDRFNANDPGARDELLQRAGERLRRIARKMLQDFSRVKKWEDTDDVLQNALIRLMRALNAVSVASTAEFFRLAATQIRRELLDLARRYSGRESAAGKRASQTESSIAEGPRGAARERGTTTHDPKALAAWSEFHKQIGALPDEEREVVDLLWYQGLTRMEVATLLKVSESTIKRRWLAGRLRLQEAMRGQELRW